MKSEGGLASNMIGRFYLGMRRPETYGELIQPDGDNPKWKIKSETIVE